MCAGRAAGSILYTRRNSHSGFRWQQNRSHVSVDVWWPHGGSRGLRHIVRVLGRPISFKYIYMQVSQDEIFITILKS